MNTEEYKAHLSALLRSLSQEEREEAVSFYMESIADRIDEGMSEEEAVASMVSPGQAAEAIIAEASEKKKTLASPEAHVSGDSESGLSGDSADNESIYAEDHIDASIPSDRFFTRLKEHRLTPLEWVALIVTSPLWLTLLIAAAACALGLAIGIAAIMLALYICAWALIACLWIIGGAFVVSSPAALVFVIWGLQTGNAPFSLVNAGYSLVLFGVGMWILKGALAITRAFLRWQKENIVARFSKRGSGPNEAAGSTNASSVTSQSCSTNEASVRGDDDVRVDGIAAESPDAGTVDAPSTAAHTKPYAMLFRICWILALIGLACILAGYLASGFDWRVFLTLNFSHGKVYLSGTEVAHPERLFLSPWFWSGLA